MKQIVTQTPFEPEDHLNAGEVTYDSKEFLI